MICIVKKLEFSYHVKVHSAMSQVLLTKQTIKGFIVLGHNIHFSITKLGIQYVDTRRQSKLESIATFLSNRIQTNYYSPSQQISSIMAGKTTRIILRGNLKQQHEHLLSFHVHVPLYFTSSPALLSPRRCSPDKSRDG